MPRNSVLSAFLLLIALAGLTGCNTIAGAGQDMQDAGEAVEDEAEE